jgi:hypothetical protein
MIFRFLGGTPMAKGALTVWYQIGVVDGFIAISEDKGRFRLKRRHLGGRTYVLPLPSFLSYAQDFGPTMLVALQTMFVFRPR